MDNLNFFPLVNNLPNNSTRRLPSRLLDAEPQAPGGSGRGNSDGLTLSPEAQEDDGRDRAIDEYFQKLAQDRGNTPDAQNFAELMGYITKELKDIDKMDWRSAHDKFADTIHNVQDKVDAKGITAKGSGDAGQGDAKSDTSAKK